MPVLVFVLLTFASSWLIVLMASQFSSEITWAPIAALVVMMWTPGLSAITCSLIFEGRSGVLRRLGLGVPAWKPWLTVSALGSLAAIATTFGSLFVGDLLGVYELDLIEMGGMRELMAAQLGGEVAEGVDMTGILWMLLLTLPVMPFINVPVTLGEELGWRGYLLPKLLPLGTWPALLLHSVIWGLWHAPAVLIFGHNYGPGGGLAGVAMMTAMCVFLGLLHGWTRLRTGSVWPAAFMHSAINGSAGFVVLFAAAGHTLDPFAAGVTGWSGFIIPAAIIVVLIAFGQFKPVFDEAHEQ